MANQGGDTQYQATLDISGVIANLRKMQSENEKTAKAQERAYQKSQKEAVAATRAQIQEHQKVIRLSSQLDKSLANEAKAYEKLTKAAQEAGKAGESVGKSAQLSGVQIGAMAGIVGALTNEFINLGQKAVDALIQIGEKSVETALEIDTLKARLGGIFDGNQEAADQAFNFIQKKSKELGIDLGELAGAFIPKTESLAQFERVAKIATALARSDQEQGAIGARIALIEALSGTFTSLQRRFEIPKGDIDRLKEAFDTGGMEAFLSEFETVLDESGKGFDDLANTAQASFDRLSIAGEQILGRVGEPIVASLEEAAGKISEFLDANEDDIIVFADTIGRAIADAIDFISSVDLSQLDTEGLIQFADYIFRIVEATKLLTTQLADFSGAIGPVLSPLFEMFSLLDELFVVLTNLDQAFIFATKSAAGIEAVWTGLTTAIQPLLDVLETLGEALTAIGAGDFAGAADAINAATEQAKQGIFDMQAGLEAAQGVVSKTEDRLKAYNDAVNENSNAQDNLRKKLDESRKAGTGAADSIQQLKAANREAAEDADKLAEAQTKVNEATAKAEKDFQRELEDIDLETERKRMDILTQGAQAREDQARKNLQKIADIQRDNQQAITDAATDLNRKEEDIAHKFANERIDLERENRQKRVDIEKDYRQKLEDIQSQSDADLEDAERSRDAVAFLRIVRQRQQQVQEAQTSRNRDIEELRINGEQRKEELKVQQAREQEEAQISNERKLEDLRVSLERRLEEQRTANEREFEDIRINEARKLEELALSRERDIADAKLAHERKLEDLRLALAEELAMIEEFAAKKAAAEAAAKSKPSSFNPKYSGSEFKVPAGTSRGPGGKPAYKAKSIYGFANGGAFTVGGYGAVDSQLVQFMASPGERVMISPPTGGGSGVTNNNQRSMSAQIQMADPNSLTATQRAIVRAEIMNILGDL